MGRDPDSDLGYALMRLAWRIDALDEWRKDMEKRLGDVETLAHKIDRSDEIAREVAKRLNSRGASYAWWQKAGALLGGALVLADAVKGLVS